MTYAATLAFAALLLAQTGLHQEPPEPGPEINWPTQVGPDDYFNSRLPIARLQATPEWEAGEENPPLSARKAIAVSEALVKQLNPYGPDAELNPPTLKLRESGGRWFWVVYFSPNDWRQFQSSFPIVVLMDGTAVKPERTTPPQQLLIDGM